METINKESIRTVTLLPAGPEHSRFLYMWRNNPATRKYMNNSEFISTKEHEQWFEKTLKRDDVQIFIGMVNDEPIGTIRIDRRENYGYEVSYTVAPGYRNRGLATSMLIQITEGHHPLYASIKWFNIASIKVAQKAGLKPFSFRKGNLSFTNDKGVLEIVYN